MKRNRNQNLKLKKRTKNSEIKKYNLLIFCKKELRRIDNEKMFLYRLNSPNQWTLNKENTDIAYLCFKIRLCY